MYHGSVSLRKPHNRAIEPEKIVLVKMALETFELSMQLCVIGCRKDRYLVPAVSNKKPYLHTMYWSCYRVHYNHIECTGNEVHGIHV